MLNNNPKQGKKSSPYLHATLLYIALLCLGACWCRNPEGLKGPTAKKPYSLPAPKSAIQFTIDNTKLQGENHTSFTLRLQHTGSTAAPLDNYSLALTLVEQGGNNTTLAYTDASNNFQNASAIQEQLTYFTTKKALSLTDAVFAIPITLHPGPDVKQVTITVTLNFPSDIQTKTVVWELFTPSLVTDPMIQAAQAANYNVLSSLLQKLKNGSLLTPDEKKEAMLAAASWGNQGVFETLLKVPGVNVNAPDDKGNTPLHLAVFFGNADIVSMLVHAKGNVDARNNYKETSLYRAAGNVHVGMVQSLLAAQASVNAKDILNSTPLHMAAEQGNTAIVTQLLVAKADVNAKDVRGITPLHDAVSQGHVAVVTLLLAAKADVNVKDDVGPPLHIAVQQSNAALVTLLLAAKADVNATDNLFGETPLHMAVEQKNVVVVGLLLKAGANAKATNNKGQTPGDLTQDPILQGLLENPT